MSVKHNRIMRLVSKRLTDRKGMTMVEMVVSFLLLAIFMVTVTMVISNALKTYYVEKEQMSKFTVADTVISELRSDIRRMQASEVGGFIKLRDRQTDPNSGSETITARQVSSNAEISGNMIEFVRSNEMGGLILEQIDAAGCGAGTYMIKTTVNAANETEYSISDDLHTVIAANQLTCRYYLIPPETKDPYKGKGLFMDQLKADASLADETGLATAVGHPVVWDVENRLPDILYQGLPIRLTFAVKPYQDGSDWVVSSVDVTVEILNAPLPEDGSLPEVLYTKKGTIPLQNRVCYKNENTLYSEQG